MFAPAATGLGVPLLVTIRSQTSLTLVTTIVVLVFTEFDADSVEVAVIAAAVTVGATFTTTTISAASPTAKVGSVQTTFPVAPTAGVVQVQPAGASTDW
jgi:hypothetical protein